MFNFTMNDVWDTYASVANYWASNSTVVDAMNSTVVDATNSTGWGEWLYDAAAGVWDTTVSVAAAPANFANGLVGNATITNTTIITDELPVEQLPVEPSMINTVLDTMTEYAYWIGSGIGGAGVTTLGWLWNHNRQAARTQAEAAIDAVVNRLVPEEHRAGLSKAAKGIIAALDGTQGLDFAALAQVPQFRALAPAALAQFMTLAQDARVNYARSMLALGENAVLTDAVRAQLIVPGAQAAYVNFINGLAPSSIRLINQFGERAADLRGLFMASAGGQRAYQRMTSEEVVNAFVRGAANSRGIALVEDAPVHQPARLV